MLKVFVIVSALTFVTSFAFGKTDPLVKKMNKACSKELKQWCPDKTEGEDVWKCIEDKEEGEHQKLSKGCHAAHEKYEAKYHKEAEENEHHEMGEGGEHHDKGEKNENAGGQGGEM